MPPLNSIAAAVKFMIAMKPAVSHPTRHKPSPSQLTLDEQNEKQFDFEMESDVAQFIKNATALVACIRNEDITDRPKVLAYLT